MNKLIVIGGNPGSGKTTISKLLEKQRFVHLEIDAFYQKTSRTPEIQNWFEDHDFLDDAYSNFKEAILNNIAQNHNIVIETAGVGIRWKRLFSELVSTFPDQIITIYLNTTKETSLQRVNARNATNHPIKINEERLNSFFSLGKDAMNDFQHIIDSNRSVDEVFKDVSNVI